MVFIQWVWILSKKSYLWYKSKSAWQFNKITTSNLVGLVQIFGPAIGRMEYKHQSYFVTYCSFIPRPWHLAIYLRQPSSSEPSPHSSCPLHSAVRGTLSPFLHGHSSSPASEEKKKNNRSRIWQAKLMVIINIEWVT